MSANSSPNQDPIGRTFDSNPPGHNGGVEIVGVVRDARYADPALPPEPFFGALSQNIHYTDIALQQGEKWSHFINGAQFWLSGDIGRLEPQIRKVFAEVDPNLAIINMHPLQDQIDIHFEQQRTVAELSTLFGGLAILLASIGLYGVMSYAVARRTGEIGVRIVGEHFCQSSRNATVGSTLAARCAGIALAVNALTSRTAVGRTGQRSRSGPLYRESHAACGLQRMTTRVPY